MKTAFEKRLEDGVKAPELPKKTVELLPMPTADSDPQPPPVDHIRGWCSLWSVLEACHFECTRCL
jgi:hypothetical protein